jgi:hypothetical protein
MCSALLKELKASLSHRKECANYGTFLYSPVGHAHSCSWSAVFTQVKLKFGWSVSSLPYPSWALEIYFVTHHYDALCLLALLTCLVSHHLPWGLVTGKYEEMPIQVVLVLRDFVLHNFALTQLENLYHFSNLRDNFRFNMIWHR